MRSLLFLLFTIGAVEGFFTTKYVHAHGAVYCKRDNESVWLKNVVVQLVEAGSETNLLDAYNILKKTYTNAEGYFDLKEQFTVELVGDHEYYLNVYNVCEDSRLLNYCNSWPPKGFKGDPCSYITSHTIPKEFYTDFQDDDKPYAVTFFIGGNYTQSTRPGGG